MRAPVLFGEADLENDLLGESAPSCSYAPEAPASAIHDLRTPDDEPATPLAIPHLRSVEPSPSLLRLSGVAEEPLRESRETFRLALAHSAGAASPLDGVPEGDRVTVPMPASIEEALLRAARSSFASEPPRPVDRPSGVRMSEPRTIEEAVLRVVEADEPLRERYKPNA